MASAGILLLEFCLLCFIGVAWWVARRDLNARAATSQSPTLKTVRQVEESIAGLLKILESRAEKIEEEIQLHEKRLNLRREELDDLITRAESMQIEGRSTERQTTFAKSDLEPGQPSVSVSRGQEVADIPIEEMIAEGLDTKSIARKSGLAVAEVETLIRMQQLRRHGNLSE